MKKILLIASLITLTVSTSMSADKESRFSSQQLLFDRVQSMIAISRGYAAEGVRSPFGRYLLLKNDKSLLALKLEKNLPSKYEWNTPAQYSWVLYRNMKDFDHLDDDMVEVTEGSFKIDERSVTSGRVWIEIGGFKCSWSSGGWVYFNQNFPNLQMALTEATCKSELNAIKVKWVTKSSVEKELKEDSLLIALKKSLDPNRDKKASSKNNKKKQQAEQVVAPDVE